MVSTDIADYFTKEYIKLRKLEKINEEHLRFGIEDGRKLNFQTNSFNKVYSISVLEHIPDEGDSEWIKEIARVLSKGGKCFITVPFSEESKIECTNRNFYWKSSSIKISNGKIFYQRRYSEKDLYQRLIIPS